MGVIESKTVKNSKSIFFYDFLRCYIESHENRNEKSDQNCRFFTTPPLTSHVNVIAYLLLISFSLLKFNLPLIGTFTWPTPPGPYRAKTCRRRELNLDHIHAFLTTQGHGGPPRMSDQPNVGATSEIAQTWKTIHTKHTLTHPNKAKMEWWWRRPNDIRGPWGPKVSWHLSYRRGKTPKKPHPGNLSRPGIEPGPAAWQARMLPFAPQRWTPYYW